MVIYAPQRSWGATKPPVGAIPDPSHPFQHGLRQHFMFNEGRGATINDVSKFKSVGTMNAAMDPTTEWVTTEKG